VPANLDPCSGRDNPGRIDFDQNAPPTIATILPPTCKTESPSEISRSQILESPRPTPSWAPPSTELHFAACIARERNRLTVQRCEPIDPRWTQWILGFIQNRKKAIAFDDLKRMASGIGVSANLVCQPRSGGLLRFQSAGERAQNSQKTKQDATRARVFRFDCRNRPPALGLRFEMQTIAQNYCPVPGVSWTRRKIRSVYRVRGPACLLHRGTIWPNPSLSPS
jgi:hypothetical protein